MKKLIILLFSMWCSSCYASSDLNVVVSIQPIHSLVSQVMGNIGKPDLLLPPNSSPHHFQLRPTDAQRIHEADLIIWVGPELESFLEKPLSALNPNASTLTLSQIDSIVLLPYQHHELDDKTPDSKKAHEAHQHEHHHGDHHTHEHGEFDPHIWLSPEYAKLIVKAVEDILIKTYPLHKKTFKANAKNTIKNLDSLSLDIKKSLKDVKELPFLVYHDGYQYFTRAFGLNFQGFVTDDPHAPLSLNKIRSIKSRINEDNIYCLFGEPDTNLKILEQITKNTKANLGVLDPVGMDIEPGNDAYHQLMTQLASSYKSCMQSEVTKEAKEP